MMLDKSSKAYPLFIMQHNLKPLMHVNSTFFAVALVATACFLPSNNLMSEEPAAKDKTVKTTAETPVKKPIPTDAELKKMLTPEQYAVTRENATERPFTNEFWKNNKEGIYVDIISGEALFSSKDKFDTECGWPGFSKPINDDEIAKLSDKSHGMDRSEVRSKTGNAHLGHVFNDGPVEKGGLRYCINSASLRFIAKDKMKEAGYGKLLYLFEAEKPKEQPKSK